MAAAGRMANEFFGAISPTRRFDGRTCSRKRAVVAAGSASLQAESVCTSGARERRHPSSLSVLFHALRRPRPSLDWSEDHYLHKDHLTDTFSPQMNASSPSLPTLGQLSERGVASSRSLVFPPVALIRSDSSLLKPRSIGDGKLATAATLEDEARRTLVAQERVLQRGAASGARLLLKAKNRAHVIALRQEYDAETGKDLKTKLAHVRPATDEEATELSTKLNIAMCEKYPDKRSQSTYFILFRYMDEDSSGAYQHHYISLSISRPSSLPHLFIVTARALSLSLMLVAQASSPTLSSPRWSGSC